MLILRQLRRNAAGVAVLVLVAAAVAVWLWMPARTGVRTIPTGASFNISVTRSQDGAHAKAIAAQLEGYGLPAFTRILNRANRVRTDLQVGPSYQVIVGPYVSIDEAEGAQRRLAARGFGARMLVDESVRRAPGYDGIPMVSAGANVLLVAAAGRLSVVIEMSDEPRHVQARRVTPTSLEVETGPVLAAVESQRWNAPDGVSLIEGVSVEAVGAASQRFLRTRIAVSESARSNVRVVGRRLYIDLWSPEPVGRASSTRLTRRSLADEDHTAAATTGDMPDYRETIRPAVARLESMEPFVLSAAASPIPTVLTALSGNLKGLQQWIQSVEAPDEWAEAHGALIAGVGLALKAVDPEFSGDRTAQAREAFALLNLQSTLSPPPSPEARP